MREDYKSFLDWVVYQIYPKSFLDTNGDGWGDLNGVEQKLDYISSLGANAIWLCPIYKSPQKDNGYDISSYRQIDERYGGMEDFDRLVSVAKRKGIKIIMDLVANHTSSEHEWFVQARSSRDNPYHDYYYFVEKPTNEWQSVFGGSAWEYNAQTDEYYLHSFAVEQPDLNWQNPKVRQEFCEIIDFWVDKGVDGFRCDVLDFIAKDFDKDKMYGGDELHEYVQGLFSREKVKKLFTVGECQADEKSILELCGEERGELKCSFQFEHLSTGRSKFIAPFYTFEEFAKVLVKWQEFSFKTDFLYVLFTDNHDYPWLNSRMGNDKAKRYYSSTSIALLVYGLRGIPFIYQGQELGSANSKFEKIDDFDDVEVKNYYGERKGKIAENKLLDELNYGNRDNTRRPFAWTIEKNHGFTDGTPWIAFSTRSNEINLEREVAREKSVFAFYRELFSLRNSIPALRYGGFKDVTNGKGFIAYEREYGDEKYLIVCNFERERKITGYGYGVVKLANFTAKRDEKISIDRTFQEFECAMFLIERV